MAEPTSPRPAPGLLGQCRSLAGSPSLVACWLAFIGSACREGGASRSQAPPLDRAAATSSAVSQPPAWLGGDATKRSRLSAPHDRRALPSNGATELAAAGSSASAARLDHAAATASAASTASAERSAHSARATHSASDAAPSAAAPPSRVLVIGDSLSDEARGGGGWVRLLRSRCPKLQIDNRAQGGFMVNQMRRRLEREGVASGTSHAIVFGGVNDLYSDLTAQRTLPRIQADLSRIYSYLGAHGVSVIAITVAPWGGFHKYFTEPRSEATQALNRFISTRSPPVTAVIDAYGLLSCGEKTVLCPAYAVPFKDGLHFGKVGQTLLGEALLASSFSGCNEG